MSSFQIPNLLTTPQNSIDATWRCANLPTTLQVLNSARDNFPNYITIIDTLRQSLTQTIFVSLINASTSPINGIEMPTIASLAPNNTSLHLNSVIPTIGANSLQTTQFNGFKMDSDSLQQSRDYAPFQCTSAITDPSPDLLLSDAAPSSRRDSFPFSVSSPAKSELSINTDASSVDIRSDLGSLSIKSTEVRFKKDIRTPYLITV